MKRFFQKSYSWLATLLLAVAFAVSGSVDAQTEFTFGRSDADYQVMTFTKDGISVTGFGYNCGYAAWGDYPSINMYVDADAGPRTLTVSVPSGTIEKIEMTTTQENGTNTNFKDVTVNAGSFSTSGNTSAVWEGNASEVVFTPGENTNVYVNKVIVYASGVEAGGEDSGTTDGGEAKAVELPFAFTTSAGGTVDGVGFYMWSADWSSSTELYGEGDATATWGTVNINCAAAKIIKVELTCRTNSWSGVSSNEAAAATVCETENLEGYFTTSGNVATWVGAAHNLTFSSTDDIDVYKIVVYTLEEGTVKECTIDVDHYADNCKPGKVEYITKYITLYMQSNTTSTSWTGKDNCPEGVTLTNEAGEQFPISQFNYWTNSDQLGIVLQEEITTPGVYTLHIPEGIVAFEGSKWNKEINVEWTIAAPDLREKKEVNFDFTKDFFSTNVDDVNVETNGAYNENAGAIRLGASATISFTAPEGSKIIKIQLNNNSGYYQDNYSMLLTVPQGIGEQSAAGTVFTWEGDEQSVTFQAGSAICISNAVVTLALEKSTEPEVDPAETAYYAWKQLVTNEMKAVRDEWVTAPDVDIPGQKPASVISYVINYYNNVSWLFGNSGFGDDWASAKEYYAYYGTSIEANYAEALQIWQAYLDAELVPEVVEPAYTEPVLKAEDVSAEVAYYIYTEARGGLTVDGDQLKGTKEVGKDVNPADVQQQFAFVNWEGNLYLYSLAAEKFIGKANRGNFTEEPVDPIYFKNADNSTVMLYFDDSFNFNLGGNNQVTIDTWSKKDGGNSFIIKVAEKFDQTALLEKLAGGGEVIDPVDPVDLSKFAGEWFFKGEGAYCASPENIDGALNPKDEYTVNINVENGEIYMTGLVGDVYDYPYAYVGTYDAKAGTLSFDIPSGYYGKYIIDTNWEYYIMTDALVFNVEEAEDGIITLVNDGWDFLYEDWYYSQYACGYTSCVMTREKQDPIVEPTEWNGNIIYPETASTLDELLNYTIEFEEASSVEASGYDVLAAIFDETGDPYAIAIANGVFDAYGSISFEGSKATVNFMKISDLTPKAQDSVFLHIARINGFTQPAGHASVVFASKSFKVDGELIYDTLQKDYVLGENGVTGIDTIATESNDSIYDLNGRRVNSVRSGLYIKNGVKVFMK